MAEESPKLDWEELNKLTNEVNAPTGPGSGEWEAGRSHTRQFNEDVIAALRENEGKVPGELGDVDLLILTTTGAKSGQPRTVPLGCHVVDGRLLIIASMGGADRNPPWFHNVRANPGVTVEKDGEKFEAEAVITEGSDRDDLYGKICERMEVFAEYQERTERLIPVIELRRLSGGASI